MKMSSHLFRKKGFTLVELLVAVAIMLSLSAIAFLAMSGASSKAQDAKCVTQLKDLWAAGRQFADDWNGMLPANGMPDLPDSAVDESLGWMAAIAPYVYGNDDVANPNLDEKFRCPLDRVLALKDGFIEMGPQSVSYVPWTDGSNYPENPQSPINVSRGYDQSNVPWLSDGAEMPVSVNVATNGEYMEYVDRVKDRHRDGINVLYVGGVVKKVVEPTFEKVAPNGVTKMHLRR